MTPSQSQPASSLAALMASAPEVMTGTAVATPSKDAVCVGIQNLLLKRRRPPYYQPFIEPGQKSSITTKLIDY
jgi:hypothetical protein